MAQQGKALSVRIRAGLSVHLLLLALPPWDNKHIPPWSVLCAAGDRPQDIMYARHHSVSCATSLFSAV